MLEVKNLKKSFGNKKVLKGISFNVSKGDVIGIIGPSGCGKSTLLRCLNLLELPTSGTIIFEGKKMNYYHNLPATRQKIGMVFQSFNLFENMTVLENLIIAPVKLKIQTKDEAIKLAKGYLKEINLENKINEYPKNLSGGEKQRVAIIRALMEKPKILLLDEPTSSLDPQMKQEVLELISKLKDYNMTIIVVSHELNFVKDFSSRIIFLDNKTIISDDTVKGTFSSENEIIKNFFKDIN